MVSLLWRHDSTEWWTYVKIKKLTSILHYKCVLNYFSLLKYPKTTARWIRQVDNRRSMIFKNVKMNCGDSDKTPPRQCVLTLQNVGYCLGDDFVMLYNTSRNIFIAGNERNVINNSGRDRGITHVVQNFYCTFSCYLCSQSTKQKRETLFLNFNKNICM